MRIRDYPNSYRRGGAGLGFQGPGPSGPGGRPPPGSTAPPPAPPQPRIPSNPQKRFPMPTPGQLARRRLLDMLPPYRAGKAIQYGTKIALKIAEYYLEHPDQYAGPKALGPDVIESNGWCVPQWCPSRPPGNTTGVASFGGPCPTPPIEKCMAPQYMTEQPFFIAVRGTWGHGCWMTGPDDFGRYLITHWWKLPYYDPGRPAPVPLPELVPGVAVPVLEPSPWPDVWPDLYPPNVPRPRPAPPPIHFVPHLPELPGREGGNEPRPANPWAPTIPKPNGQQDNGWRPPQVAPPYAPPYVYPDPEGETGGAGTKPPAGPGHSMTPPGRGEKQRKKRGIWPPGIKGPLNAATESADLIASANLGYRSASLQTTEHEHAHGPRP